MKLLLVDDDEDTVVLLEMLLVRQGWEVLAAASVREARELLAAAAVPDVVLSDFNLGDGLGTSLFETGRPDGVRLALLVSGACEQIAPTLLASARFDRCLAKPVEPKSLLLMLQPLLASSSARETS